MRLVDASVAIKWIVRETGSDRAAELIGEQLAAPDFALVELANILWKKVTRDEIPAVQALAGFAQVERLLDIMPTPGFEARALELGVELGHPVYDCLYLAVAEATDVPIVTADQRFIRRCASTAFAGLVQPLA